MTSENLHKVLSYLVDWLNSHPNHWFYAAGVIVASLALTPIIVEEYKRLHLKFKATEVTNHMIDFVVTVTAVLMAVADFFIVNGTNTANLLPWLAVVMPTIKAFAPSIYTYSKALHGWFVNRQKESQKQRLQALLNATDNIPQPSYSPGPMGRAAQEAAASEPPANLFSI